MRVRLWKCRECGSLYGGRSGCIDRLTPAYPECRCDNREPIEYAPLPSEETRNLTLELIDYKMRAMGDQNTKRAYAAALAELQAAWKETP